MLFEAKQNEIPGLLLSIDFQQALILSHGNLFIKLLIILTLVRLSKNGLQFFNQALNLAFY